MDAEEEASAAASAAACPATSCGETATLLGPRGVFAAGLVAFGLPAVAVWLGFFGLLVVARCLRCSTTVGASVVAGVVVVGGGASGLGVGAVREEGGGGAVMVVEVV